MKAKLPLFFAIACLLLGALLLPISNFLPRKIQNDRVGDGDFASFTKVMQESCADCHSSSSLAADPIYARFPLASTLIARDRKEAQTVLNLSQEQLTGTEPISPPDLYRIASSVSNGSMPPGRYRALHWKGFSGLTEGDKRAVLRYVQGVSTRIQCRPLPVSLSAPPSLQVELGRKLFFEKRLSAHKKLSCAGCHAPDKGGADALPVAISADPSGRALNTPTVFNAALNFKQYWDGRTSDLKQQALVSLSSAGEMGGLTEDRLAELRSDSAYSGLAERAYGVPLSPDVIADAIAVFEQTLITPGCKFDRYLKGEKTALSGQALKGYFLFQEKGCVSCHSGMNLGGMTFEKMGIKGDYFAHRLKNGGKKVNEADLGRFNVTRLEADRYRFKVPALRNVALTAPYFHDGSVSTLEEAVQDMARFQQGQELRREEVTCLVEFLKSLTGKLNSQEQQEP
ncbi:MAG: heme-binding domain-containing protein [Candidatus Obscuribacter sp.]|nr:heme-binding domain-containing protein [Candidatus Obscuribacter sp.]